MLINISIFITCIIFLIIFTIYIYKNLKNSNKQYFLNNRNTGFFALTATLVMTELNTATLIGFASMGYIFGPSAILLSFVFFFGLMFYAFVVSKKWKLFNGFTVTNLFSEKYGIFIGNISAIILLVSMIGFSASYIKSLALIFNPLFLNLNMWSLTAFFCFIMIFLTLRGGLKSIIFVDKISFLITIIIIPLLCFFSFQNSSQITNFTNNFNLPKYPFETFLALTIITIITYMLSPWYGQKIFSAKNKNIAFKSVFFASIFITIIYGLAIISASTISHSVNLSNPQNSIPFLIYNTPLIFQIIAYITLFFIATTTISGLWNTISSILISHKWTKNFQKTQIEKSIFITLFIAILSFILANVFIDKIFQKMILLNIPISSLGFSLLCAFYSKIVSKLASIFSIFVGFFGGFFCYFYFGEDNYIKYWAFIIIPLHFIIGYLTLKIENYIKNKLK